MNGRPERWRRVGVTAMWTCTGLGVLAACQNGPTEQRADAPLPTGAATYLGTAGGCHLYRLAGDPEVIVVTPRGSSVRCAVAVESPEAAAAHQVWQRERGK